MVALYWKSANVFHDDGRDINTPLGQYASIVRRAISEGLPTPAPSNFEELDWLIKEYPLRAVPFLPDAQELRRLGMSKNVCRPERIKPLPVEFLESFLMSLNDPDFASAVRERLEAISG